jgi:arsenate reductase
LLRDNGIEPTIVEYLKTPPTRAEIANLVSDASDDELLDAMAANPILIERPFVATAKGTRLARPVDAVREIL